MTPGRDPPAWQEGSDAIENFDWGLPDPGKCTDEAAEVSVGETNDRYVETAVGSEQVGRDSDPQYSTLKHLENSALFPTSLVLLNQEPLATHVPASVETYADAEPRQWADDRGILDTGHTQSAHASSEISAKSDSHGLADQKQDTIMLTPGAMHDGEGELMQPREQHILQAAEMIPCEVSTQLLSRDEDAEVAEAKQSVNNSLLVAYEVPKLGTEALAADTATPASPTQPENSLHGRGEFNGTMRLEKAKRDIELAAPIPSPLSLNGADVDTKDMNLALLDTSLGHLLEREKLVASPSHLPSLAAVDDDEAGRPIRVLAAHQSSDTAPTVPEYAAKGLHVSEVVQDLDEKPLSSAAPNTPVAVDPSFQSHGMAAATQHEMFSAPPSPVLQPEGHAKVSGPVLAPLHRELVPDVDLADQMSSPDILQSAPTDKEHAPVKRRWPREVLILRKHVDTRDRVQLDVQRRHGRRALGRARD